MRLASVLHPLALGDAPTIRRTATLAIVVALHILVLVMLLRLAPPVFEPPRDPPTPLVVQLLPEAPAPRAKPSPAERRVARAKAPEPAKPRPIRPRGRSHHPRPCPRPPGHRSSR
jgi:protein TonB